MGLNEQLPSRATNAGRNELLVGVVKGMSVGRTRDPSVGAEKVANKSAAYPP